MLPDISATRPHLKAEAANTLRSQEKVSDFSHIMFKLFITTKLNLGVLTDTQYLNRDNKKHALCYGGTLIAICITVN
jgi:hypothetical protein